VVLSGGKPFSSLRIKQPKPRPFNILKIGLNTDREVLYQRINLRADQMLTAGLVEEVKSLLPYRHFNALITVGYSEIFSYLDGEKTLTQAVEEVKQNTRRFAKRQLTWFRKDPEIKWFEPQAKNDVLEYCGEQISGM
jgi:tRNA dimethylallyltransferase